jgi:hypothetical protein
MTHLQICLALNIGTGKTRHVGSRDPPKTFDPEAAAMNSDSILPASRADYLKNPLYLVHHCMVGLKIVCTQSTSQYLMMMIFKISVAIAIRDLRIKNPIDILSKSRNILCAQTNLNPAKNSIAILGHQDI